MKVLLKNIKPNPYRNMAKYPINRYKVEKLKKSIDQTGFWDNILARPAPNEPEGVVQLAYGHHRLIALQELGIEEVDIPVKDLDDAIMLQVMVNENMTDWTPNTAVMNESVRAVRDYLNGELEKHDYKDSHETIRVLFESEHAYMQTKRKKVGQATILRFLGKNWTNYMVQNALENLAREDELEAIEQIEQPSHAKEFRKALREVEEELKEKQPTQETHSEDGEDDTPEPAREITIEKKKELAAKIQQKLQEERQSRKAFTKTNPSHPHFRSTRDKIKSMIREEVNQESEFEAAHRMIKYDLETIEEKAGDLTRKINHFNMRLNDMNVEKISQMSTVGMSETFISTVRAIRSLMEKLEITF